MKTYIFKVLFFGVVALFAFNADASSCGFSRDLMQGSRGEAVRCLQQYLTGVGYGLSYPDGVFGPRTMQSVMLWQANYGLPAYGTFDYTSRAKYSELTGVYTGGEVLGSQFVWQDSEKERAEMRIEEALIMIEDADDEIDDSNENTSKAEDSLEEAKDDILDAVIAFYVDKDYDEAYDKADDAYENAEDAYDEAEGDGDEDNARDAIDDARDAIEDARDEIEDADDDGADVDEAEDLLDDAEDTLDDAEDEFDDEDYDNAEELADEARDLADEAIDAIDW